jgi:hypothetical protein
MWALLAYICLHLPIFAACNTILVPKFETFFPVYMFGEQHHTSCFQDPKLDGNYSTNHAQMSIKAHILLFLLKPWDLNKKYFPHVLFFNTRSVSYPLNQVT